MQFLSSLFAFLFFFSFLSPFFYLIFLLCCSSLFSFLSFFPYFSFLSPFITPSSAREFLLTFTFSLLYCSLRLCLFPLFLWNFLFSCFRLPLPPLFPFPSLFFPISLSSVITFFLCVFILYRLLPLRRYSRRLLSSSFIFSSRICSLLSLHFHFHYPLRIYPFYRHFLLCLFFLSCSMSLSTIFTFYLLSLFYFLISFLSLCSASLFSITVFSYVDPYFPCLYLFIYLSVYLCIYFSILFFIHCKLSIRSIYIPLSSSIIYLFPPLIILLEDRFSPSSLSSSPSFSIFIHLFSIHPSSSCFPSPAPSPPPWVNVIRDLLDL